MEIRKTTKQLHTTIVFLYLCIVRKTRIKDLWWLVGLVFSLVYVSLTFFHALSGNCLNILKENKIHAHPCTNAPQQ